MELKHRLILFMLNFSKVLAAFIIIPLMMETASTSETSVNVYQTTQRYNPEDSHLHTRLKSD
jgi:hypothetical protein